MPLLSVEHLTMEFPNDGAPARAIDDVSFELERGHVLGLVGESGCGKSMTALCVMRLVPTSGRIAAGRIVFDGRDLLALPEHEIRALRGARIAMIFQEPMTALNPVLTAGYQIAEALRIHEPISRRDAWARAVELLGEVGIPEPATRAHDYSHQLSGGMRQRVMIAMAIACKPDLLIADEPTTALDVTIQAEILDLLRRLRDTRGMAVVLITHDLGIVAEQADRVAIMYAGRIVEQAPTRELFANPLHPYTRALLRSMPTLGAHRERLEAIPGNVPDITRRPSGCSFRDRCALATADCATAPPALVPKAPAHAVACINV
ncbi:MAG TPA: ABC transporter ATP-binding protein [Candidatus Eisenbacteria bacterium]|nr:ABC transporter ATP-binding protein [Candidatus Eisenbacteria bacterium]